MQGETRRGGGQEGRHSAAQKPGDYSREDVVRVLPARRMRARRDPGPNDSPQS